MLYRILLIISLITLSEMAFCQNTLPGYPGGGGSPHPPKPRFTVAGEAKELNLSLYDTGGELTLPISTNQSTPVTEDLPYWITVTESTKKSFTFRYEENNSSSSRSNWFTIKSGKLSVRVNVSQPAGKPKIIMFEFANTMKNGDFINNFGSTLYASDIRYLSPRFTYNGPGTAKSKTLYVKILNPDGSFKQGNSAPKGYSFLNDVTFYPGTNNTIALTRFGDDSKSLYSTGEHKIEVYCDGSLLASGSVMLNRKLGESTYLTVDNKTSLSYNFDSKGSQKTFYVSSDCAWRLTGIPSFCKVTNQTPTSFTLECEQNVSTKPRSDYMLVRTDNQTVRIDIEQSAGTGAKINKVWVDYNDYENGEKGMRIHVDFNTYGLQNHRIVPCVFFYYKDGEKLQSYTGSGYCTSDGQATVQKSTIATYENSHWSDYSLFMPYSKLRARSTGVSEGKLYVIIKDDTTDKWIAESDWEHFTIR